MAARHGRIKKLAELLLLLLRPSKSESQSQAQRADDSGGRSGVMEEGSLLRVGAGGLRGDDDD